jgi:hypothetical protein
MDSLTDCAVRISGGVNLNRNYVRVDGFEITGSGVDACGVGVEVVNNYVHDITGSSEWGITTCYNGSVGSDRFTLIENNEVADTGFKGLFAFGEGVTVRGNYIHDTGDDPTKVQGVNILFEYNRIGHSWVGHTDGIEVYEVDGLTIRNNHVWDTTQNIYITDFDGATRNLVITGNVVWCHDYCNAGNDAPGIAFDGDNGNGGIANARIEGNTFYRVGHRIGGVTSGIVIRGNIFHGAGSEGVSFPGGATTSHNLYYQVLDNRSGESNVLWNVNPQFVNPSAFNFRLQAGSPAVNTGVSVSGLSTDPDGVARPVGGAWDRGAYER